MKASSCEFSSCISTRISMCYRQRKPNWNEPSRILCHEINAQSGPTRRPRSKQNRRSRTASAPWISLQSFMFAAVFSIFFCSHGVSAEHSKRQDELLFDRSEPSIPPVWLDLDHGSVLSRRDDIFGSLEPIPDETTQQPQIPLPKPFDSNLGNNFTSPSCPTFFHNFLNNDSFRNCLPLSLLLQVRNTRSILFFLAEC